MKSPTENVGCFLDSATLYRSLVHKVTFLGLGITFFPKPPQARPFPLYPFDNLPFFLSRDHQSWDWKHGGHKAQCQGSGQGQEEENDAPNKFNFREFKVMIEEAEEEDFPDDDDEEDVDNPDKDEIEKYKDMARSAKNNLIPL